jgi:hypothetical protein
MNPKTATRGNIACAIAVLLLLLFYSWPEIQGRVSLPLFILLVSIVAGVGGVVFWIWMLVDCATKERSDTNDKIVWLLIILFLNCFGALLYFFIRRPKRLAEPRNPVKWA